MQISPSCACLLRKKVYRQAFSNHFTCNQNVFPKFGYKVVLLLLNPEETWYVKTMKYDINKK